MTETSARRTIVHAGPPKTGTSAVQSWLDRHAKSLRERGIFYPRHYTDSNRVSSGNLRVATRVGPDGLTLRPEKVAKLLGRFEESGCHTLLLSSEFFYTLIQALDPLLPDATYLVYVRDPLEIVESFYNQAVKRHGLTQPFDAEAKLLSQPIDHLDALLRSEVAPRILVRPYAEELFVGGSIVEDFLDAVGIEGTDETRERINPSYTFEALELMRHANHFELGDLGPALDRALQACPVGERAYSLFPEERYEAVREEALRQVRGLVERHPGIGLGPFLELLERKPRRPHRVQPCGAEGLAAVAAHLERTEPEVHARLVAQVRAQPEVAGPSSGFREALGVEPAGGPATPDG